MISFVLLWYGLGDFLGKFIPAKYVSSNSMVMYCISLFFPVSLIYLTSYYYFLDNESFFVNNAFKCICLFLMGIINGYNTNNIFCIAINN